MKEFPAETSQLTALLCQYDSAYDTDLEDLGQWDIDDLHEILRIVDNVIVERCHEALVELEYESGKS